MNTFERENVAEKILELIDEETGYSVPEFAEMLDIDERDVSYGLLVLMNQGKITSTPDWKYRRSRRVSE